MFRPRVIPVLLLRNGALVKTVRFAKPRYIGDPINAVRIFNDLRADELVFLDIGAGRTGRSILPEFVRKVGEEANMPFAVGGGIQTLAQIRELLRVGAEKVVIGTCAATNPSFVAEAADHFGSSTITVCIDVRRSTFGGLRAWVAGGKRRTKYNPTVLAKMMEAKGAGEIILQSIERDGTMRGYDIALVRAVSDAVAIPVVALGGAGSLAHLRDCYGEGNATALGAASLFVYHGPKQGVLINYPDREELPLVTRTSKAAYQECVRCVMDTSDPEIAFDAEGRCNHCREFLERTSQLTYRGADSQQQLEGIVGRMKDAGRRADYDCVIGISGGVDSCYAASVARSLGLRVLAVHMDNGWDSETAVRNIRKVADKLQIEYESFVLNWDEFRDLQLAFLRASVPEIETPTDMAIPAALHRVAAQHGVRYIISGGNYSTEGILPKGWHYDAKDVRYLKAIHQRFGTRKLRSFPTFGYWTEAYFKFVKGMRFVYLLNYVPYSKEDATRVLQQDLDWRPYGGKHHESKITGFVQSFLLPTKFGIDYRRATLSTQICAGAVTRQQALEELAKPPFDATKVAVEKEYVAKKFEITVAELEGILAAPPRSHRDYPNNQPFLEAIYVVYRRFFGARRAP